MRKMRNSMVGLLACVCFELSGQEVITDFGADKSPPIVLQGDFLTQGPVLVKYVGKGGAAQIPADLGLTEIGPNAFGNAGVVSVSIPQGITKIGDYAFTNCQSLASIAIPDSVASIGDNAFSKCGKLERINIPLWVASIGDSVFAECTALAEITVDSYNRSYAGVNGVLFTYDQTVLLAYPAGKLDAEYAVPIKVSEIRQNAFSNNTALTRITFPDVLTAIGDRAFYNCKGLTELRFPASLTVIGDRAFTRCSGLTSLTIPAGLKRIGAFAFDGCVNLAEILLIRTTEYDATAFRNVPGKFPYAE
ncbi:MAG: leucine-rich repeat domain-containing protein [Spirochaetaceae bacterium]|nr:leucine-rich repeat domain-containing protein [Spirochaetaceae bacterium]